MSLEDGVCGTGGWSGPLPGDPNNDSVLTATTVYGGIQLAWTYPTINPNAVAHTLLYRGISLSPSEALLHRTVTGDSYFDIANPEEAVTFFYWIKIVSVYGTVGPLIGPASVVALPTIQQLIQELTGKIDDSLLATSLRSDIASIATLAQEIDLEIQNRIASNVALGNALAAVQTEAGELTTYILNETTQRQTADSAQVTAINAMAVGQGENAAAIVTEAAVRLAADSALATNIETLVSRLTAEGDVGSAIIISEQTASQALDDASTALWTALNKNRSFYQVAEPDPLIVTLSAGDLWVDVGNGNQLYRWDGFAWINIEDSRLVSIAESITLLQAKVDDPLTGLGTKASIGYVDTAEANAISASATSSQALVASAITANNIVTNAAIQVEADARAYQDGVLAGQITTVQSTLGDDIAQVQTSLQTNIDTVEGEVINIGALYTAKVNVNGLIGGFGIYNDAKEVSAGFDVDNFWIGRTGLDKTKPFIINGGIVYMNNAMIANGSIDNAKIGNIIQSANYVAGSAGWKIDKTGQMEMNNATFRGALSAATGTFAGSLSAATGTFAGALSAATGSFAGSLSAATGTFRGALTAEAIDAVNTINIAGNAITVPDYVESSASVVIPSNTWGTILSHTVVGTLPKVVIIIQLEDLALPVRVTRNGVVIKDNIPITTATINDSSSTITMTGPSTYMLVDTTPGFNPTYGIAAKAGLTFSRTVSSRRSVLLLGVKR